MTTRRRRWTTPLLSLALLLSAVPARAFDAAETFRAGTVVLSGEGAYGGQFNPERMDHWSKLEFWDAGIRLGWLPFEPAGKDRFYFGALELGVEPLYQRYRDPHPAFWAGLSAVGRYHFLGLGRLVPYLELGVSAGGTDLRSPEISSTFSFLLFTGVGVSVFVSEQVAVYTGYRFQHVSNGNTSQPNRGFESNVGVVGASFFFR